MTQTDIRTLPESNWTFYVVGNLPTMSDIFRVDNVQDAIDIYNSMPDYLRSAIGASINGTNELDLIHRREGNTPVLVMDFASRHVGPEWSSPDIQNAIDQLVVLLNVRHQYDSTLFRGFPSIIVELDRYKDGHLDPYFADKKLQLLQSAKIHRLKYTNKYIRAIHEVFVRGEGWMARDQFLSFLSDSRPSVPGQPSKDVFVDRLNIEYKKEHSYEGQADVSPYEFHLLQAKTERELGAGERSPLNQRLQSAQATVKNQEGKGCPSIRSDGREP